MTAPRSPRRRDLRRRASKPNDLAFRAADVLCSFGPSFFRFQLAGLAADRCGATAEGVPVVLVELVGGDVFEVCHVIGAAPRWIALAAFDRSASSSPDVETVLVPYDQITKVRIRGHRPDDTTLGFDTGRPMALLPSEGTASPKARRASRRENRPRPTPSRPRTHRAP